VAHGRVICVLTRPETESISGVHPFPSYVTVTFQCAYKFGTTPLHTHTLYCGSKESSEYHPSKTAHSLVGSSSTVNVPLFTVPVKAITALVHPYGFIVNV
jgi:hypothetical protein